MLVKRPDYISKLNRFRNSGHIKVLTGVRRCGKSSIIELFIDQLIDENVPPENIIRRRFDEFSMPIYVDANELFNDLSNAISLAKEDQPVYIFLDEIQDVKDWEKVIRKLHTNKRLDVYITGSNAYLLSSDLATYIAGRYIEIPVFPLSFKEYLEFSNYTESNSINDIAVRDALFSSYVTFGGMPGIFGLHSSTDAEIINELSSIYDSVIIRDVAQRFSIRDFNLLRRLTVYIFATSGNLFSTQKIVNYLKSNGENTSITTIENYIGALEDALIMYGIRQDKISGKSLLRPLRKFYPVDTGIRNLSINFEAKDVGYQLENVVAVELLRREYKIEIGVIGQKEIDFVATRFSEKVYIQVCESLLGEEVRERELAPLNSVRDSFPKIVLTLDRFSVGTTETGIKIKYLPDWLLESY